MVKPGRRTCTCRNVCNECRGQSKRTIKSLNEMEISRNLSIGLSGLRRVCGLHLARSVIFLVLGSHICSTVHLCPGNLPAIVL